MWHPVDGHKSNQNMLVNDDDDCDDDNNNNNMWLNIFINVHSLVHHINIYNR
jgi:hypothetical protein